MPQNQIFVGSPRNLRNRIKWTEGSTLRTLRVATTGTPVDTLRAFWLSFVDSCSLINPIVKYGGYVQFKLRDRERK